ncbi:MAG: tRNA (guanine(46)-N(7))-methyltransferase TrmB [Verrucomicrobiales bacterium]
MNDRFSDTVDRCEIVPQEPVEKDESLAVKAERFRLQLEDITRPLDWSCIDLQNSPRRELELGCGDGLFLWQYALRNPHTTFIGVEREKRRVIKTSRKLAAKNVRNARVLHCESLYTLSFLIPPGSVDIIHVLFPDPWPKRRHFKNRLLQASFFEASERVLRMNGEVRLITDSEDYAQAAETAAQKSNSNFRPAEWISDAARPKTTFEMHFLSQGKTIHHRRWVAQRTEG